MRTSRSILLAIVFSAVSTPAQNNDYADSTRIIPTPQQVIPRPGFFKITSQTRIILGVGSDHRDQFAAELVNERLGELKDLQLKIVKEESIRRFSANYIFIGPPQSDAAKEMLRARSGKLTAAMKAEGYFLDVNDEGVVILAESPRGRFYGVMSLVQMIDQEKRSVVVRQASLHDWPLQTMRGVTDDISRGQVSTMENFKKIIRFLARHKLNIYSPYLEDMFVFKNHPLIGKGRGALTASEVKELDAYAKKYHVELIPIFETLGHWENILVMPEYTRFAEFPGAHTVNVSDEVVYRMLDEMIGELSAAFSSPYFNMAADESWDVGLGANKQRVAQSNIATVHAEHYKRLFEILKKYRKKPLMYGDILLDHPAILEKIPKDVIIVDWQYHAAGSYPSPATLKNAGFSFVVSPAVMNFTGPFPNYLNTVVNIQNLNREGYLNGSLGLLTSSWNDYGGEALREFNYYGYAWTAECAWQPLKADAIEFNKKFFTQFFGSEEAATIAQIVYTILSDPLNQHNWHELWRHPMLPLRASGMNYLWRVQSIESGMPLVQELLEELGKLAVRNKDHIEHLRFVSTLNLWFAKKLRVGEQVRRLTNEIPQAADRDSIRMAVLELTGDIVPGLMKLKEEFKKLWFTTNREANLQWLMMRYDRQAAYWEEKIAEVQRGDLWREPTVESPWIYHPAANPRVRDSSAVQVPKAFFRKKFFLDKAPEKATLQLIGDTHAKLWVNGKEVGEIFARRSLSLIVEHHRVKAWDITPHLLQGDNLFAVEATGYEQFSSGGVNVYAELLHSDSSLQTVVTDSTWNVTDQASPGWQNQGQSDSAWRKAVVKPYPLPVIRPNFSAGRSSWIER
ncbi:MAG: glycoside hydrolase family 20 zincin-like fold domain-containing protein [Bacteroidota bacterium]